MAKLISVQIQSAGTATAADTPPCAPLEAALTNQISGSLISYSKMERQLKCMTAYCCLLSLAKCAVSIETHDAMWWMRFRFEYLSIFMVWTVNTQSARHLVGVTNGTNSHSFCKLVVSLDFLYSRCFSNK